MGINIFPVRVPIGKAAVPNGGQLDVLMTPEFARALSGIMERIGGPDGVSTTELAKLVKTLQEQAITLVEQIGVLFDLTTVLTAAVEQQQISDAFHSDGPTDNTLPAQIDGLRLMDAMTPARSDLTQQIADLNLMLALAEGTPPIQKNTVTGAKAGNLALTSLLAALAKSGLITDSTT